MAGHQPNAAEPTRFAHASLIDAMPDAIVIVNTDGEIVDANIRAVGMFGHTREDMVGQPVEILMPEGARETHVRERKKYVQQPRVRPMGADLQLSALHRDGHEFGVEINIAPYQSPQGLVVVAAIRDTAARTGRQQDTG